MKNRDLNAVVNDASRKLSKIRGPQAIVPLKFDADGNPATPKTIQLVRLNLDDLRFLKVWKANAWDIDKTCQETGLVRDKAEKLIGRLQCFRDEDAKVRALCEIPTPSWIAAKHVENVYNGGQDNKSTQKSLEELAKIEGAYKQQAPSTEINIWNLPPLSPEQEVKAKEFFDTIAESADSDAA